MFSQSVMLMFVVVLSLFFAMIWPLSVPIGLVAGWATWEKKRRLATKKTKEDQVKDLEEQLQKLREESNE